MSRLTKEELAEFQGYRAEANQYASILGELWYQKTLIDLELENVKESIKDNAKKQQIQLKELGETYGDGSINIETGEISPV